MPESWNLPVTVRSRPAAPIAAISEEEIWPVRQKREYTRRAYRLDVRQFMESLGITEIDQLRAEHHRAVIKWRRMQREQERAAAPSPTKLYDWRHYNPEKAASFFATH